MHRTPTSRSLNRLATFLGVLLLGFILLFGWQSWRSEKDDQLRQLETVLELSQNGLDRYFSQLETELRSLALDVTEAGGEANLPRVEALIHRFSELHPENASVNYVRIDGQILASSRATAGRLPSLAGEPSFQDFLSALGPGMRLELGRPLFGAISQQWVFPIRYVVRDSLGTPVALLATSLPVALLQDFWSQAPMTEAVLIGLLRDDGYLLSRYPSIAGANPSQVYGEARAGALRQFLRERDFPAHGYVEGYNPQVGADYGNAFVRLKHYPVTVFVGLPTSQFAIAWWRRIRVPFLLVALLGVAGVFGYYFILRTERARERERLRSEAAVRGAVTEQRFLLDHMLAGVVVHGSDGRVIHGNAQACRLLGLTLDQMFGRALVDPAWRFLREDGSPMAVDEYPVPRVMAAQAPVHGMVLGLLTIRDNEPAWILCDGYPDFDEQHRLRRVIVTFVDISARRRMEQTLVRSERRFRMLYENSMDGVFQTRPDGTILSANAAACRLFNMTEVELRARGRGGIIDVEDPRLRALMQRRERDGHARGEITMVRGDGSRFEAEISSSVYTDEANQILNSVVVRDVTDRRRTEEAVAAKNLAERANRAKSDFLARMSHELRTPLHAILGFSEILELDARNPLLPVQTERLRQIREAGGHLLLLINEVLDLSRIESGTMTLNFGPVDLTGVVRDAAQEMTAVAEEGDIQLRCEKPETQIGTAWLDRVRIKQVVLNLISNAIKYNRPGGEVAVTLESEGEYVRLSVRDTGIGMTPVQLESLYRPFDRLGREESPVQGTGIGLVISRSLVELMRGRIEVHSRPGHGTEFSVVLPRFAQPGPKTSSTVPSVEAAVTPFDVQGEVLYIDDDIVNRVLMQAFLDLRPGVRLTLSADGAEGLALARERRPDLILVDMMMPGMNGLQVLQSLRADPTLAATRCIAISANAMKHEIDAALAAGFDGYLTKPLSATLLLAEVDRELSQLSSVRSMDTAQ